MRVALDQWRPVTGGREEGLARLDRAAAHAVAEGVDLLVLPEMALTGYNIGAGAVAGAAEPEGGVLDRALSGVAQARRIAILAGYPRRDDANRVLNAIRLVDATGATRATYAKTHLYGDVDRAQFAPGDGFAPVVSLGGWRIGLAICYDLEFPETARVLALDGAEIILAPTANMAPFDSVALRMVPTRAEENALYVAYCNLCGSEGAFDYVGLSCLCGPDGSDLARAGGGEMTLVADLDRTRLDAARATSTHLADRRPDLYRSLADPRDRKSQ